MSLYDTGLVNLCSTAREVTSEFIESVAPVDARELWQKLASCSTVEAKRLLPLEIAEKLCVLPLAVVSRSVHSKILTAVIPLPLNAETVKHLRFAVSMDVELEGYPEDLIKRAIQAAYCGDNTTLSKAVKKSIEYSGSLSSEQKVLPAISLVNTDSPIPGLLDAIIDRGIAKSASDIHLEPGEEGARVRFRIDGLMRLEKELLLTRGVAAQITRRVKILAGLDITQDKTPQEGGFTFQTSGVSIRVRVSLVSTVYGEKIVFRLLDQAILDSLNEVTDRKSQFSSLGLSLEQERILIAHLGGSNGTILMSGPTGSGKSTLLYAALTYLNRGSRNITTVEEPVERRIAGLNQVEITPEVGIGYAEILPTLLRQDPDVLMVGEIRENKTANLVMTAGITGHLVLSTIHASNCIEVFQRLRQLGVHMDLVATSLRLIIGQRLVPKNCPDCAVMEAAKSELRKAFSLSLGAEISLSRGCSSCQNTGILGRVCVFEFLPMTVSIKVVLSGGCFSSVETGAFESSNLNNLRQAAQFAGYRSFAFEVRNALRKGIVSPSSALTAVGLSPELFSY